MRRAIFLVFLLMTVAGVASLAGAVVAINRHGATDGVARDGLPAAGQNADGPAGAVAKAEPAVVRVETGVAPSPGQDPPGGSGVVVDARGYVLTARAVVAGASRVAVAVPGGRTSEATVVGSDPASATTLLKVDAGTLKAITLAPTGTPLLPAAGVVVLAAPPAFEVAVGAVAGVGRSLSVDDPAQPGHGVVLDDLMELDVAARAGQLGAPLLDGAGRMVGMVVASAPASGATSTPQLWAVDLNDAVPGLHQLLADGHVAYPGLGFTYSQLTPAAAADRAVPAGVLVLAVTAGSVAAQAGMAAGDVVVSANGTALDPEHSLRRLLRALPEHQGVTLVVHRAGTDRTVSVPVMLVSA